MWRAVGVEAELKEGDGDGVRCGGGHLCRCCTDESHQSARAFHVRPHACEPLT